jgi:hypothetical protein
MKPQLDQHLFRKDTHTYAVLDGASVPDLPLKLHEMRPPNYCLYRGELAPDMVYVAPYLVHVLPESQFAKWLFAECWGKHWGIFAQSAVSLVGMRKHFRSLLIVSDPAGNPLLFRFYDPRVFQTFLPTCNDMELKRFFGKINYYFAESDDAANLSRFHLAGDELHETKINPESGANGTPVKQSS